MQAPCGIPVRKRTWNGVLQAADDSRKPAGAWELMRVWMRIKLSVMPAQRVRRAGQLLQLGCGVAVLVHAVLYAVAGGLDGCARIKDYAKENENAEDYACRKDAGCP